MLAGWGGTGRGAAGRSQSDEIAVAISKHRGRLTAAVQIRWPNVGGSRNRPHRVRRDG